MTSPRINLIYARAANGVIGKDGTMPWHLPEDLAHFKQLTHGCPVIMGRKTWDSLQPKFRPLPGRTNIVITRQTDWQAEGATRAGSLEEALAQASPAPEIWVIGGAQIYAQAEPLASRAEVTEIAQDFDGDAYAPTLGPAWREIARSTGVSAKGLAFTFVTLERP
ncbi:MAG: dihydrofolate reductase [Pseudomonadota bacterium]|uniref:dihydrofolate reductase n=1 Tax=Polaromonas sp. TaxID=1869339 RepID=UPI0017FA3A04|nr:dihydrofolate reductase [Polaromonas sp.]MBA3592633.1 dihydrofolate reductase [Polaromonas sp.]MDQ3273347.1 dihydrofolate reductase [Pseudomonadota bacterium]